MNLNNLSVCKCWALVLADICQAAVFLLLRMHCEGDPTEGARVYVRGGGGVASLCCEPTRRADRCWEWRRGGRRCGEQRGPQMLQCFVPHLERRNTGRTNHPLDGLGLRAALRHVSVRVACGRRWRRSWSGSVRPSVRLVLSCELAVRSIRHGSPSHKVSASPSVPSSVCSPPARNARLS